MDVKDLMIGDWVEMNLSPSVHKSYFKAQIIVSNIISLDNNYDFDARPIPLTEEILKTNGFDIVQDGDALTIWKQKDDEYGNEVYDITIYASKGVTRFDTSIRYHGAIRKNIYYVHELQHALRLCELNELADNLNV